VLLCIQWRKLTSDINKLEIMTNDFKGFKLQLEQVAEKLKARYSVGYPHDPPVQNGT
jgi:conjugal transfer/entry exclusion protein